MHIPRRLLVGFLPLTLLLGLASLDAVAADIKEKEPGARATGKIYQWKAKDGLVYRYRVPKGYDPEKGANLTLILHGSNLDHRWGFANHSFKSFRPDDIVVSPDGTTPNGRGGHNALGQRKDAKRMKALVDELKDIFDVRGVYLYGHSQGSFFAFYFAGEYPEDVQGVVGHASGVWTQTQRGPKGHHQAIVLMHGTQDPVVPYGNSVGGFTSFEEKKYPTLRLRSLEGWNHWPAEHNGPVPNTSQQLAWCEGMTTQDPDRLEACLEVLTSNKSKERHDYAAARSVAARIAATKDTPEKLKKRAEKVVAVVDAMAKAHVEAIEIPDKGEFDGGAWIGHMPVFLRAYQGVPICEEFRQEHEKLIESQQKDAVKHFRKYWPALRKGDKKKAFQEGAAALEKGFLYYQCWNRDFLDNLAAWRKDAKALKLKRGDTKAYDAMIDDFRKAMKDGTKAFDRIHVKHGKL